MRAFLFLSIFTLALASVMGASAARLTEVPKQVKLENTHKPLLVAEAEGPSDDPEIRKPVALCSSSNCGACPTQGDCAAATGCIWSGRACY